MDAAEGFGKGRAQDQPSASRGSGAASVSWKYLLSHCWEGAALTLQVAWDSGEEETGRAQLA